MDTTITRKTIINPHPEITKNMEIRTITTNMEKNLVTTITRTAITIIKMIITITIITKITTTTMVGVITTTTAMITITSSTITAIIIMMGVIITRRTTRKVDINKLRTNHFGENRQRRFKETFTIN